MQLNQAGLKLIKDFEGFRAKAYLCPAKVWTIGYGHTSAAGDPKVVKGMTVTRAEAVEILKRDLAKYEGAVKRAIKKTMNENEYAAMVSLCYNIGPGAFAKSSVVKFFNAGKKQEAANAFGKWIKANKKILPGLVRRRAAETALFLTPVKGKIAELSPSEKAEVITGKGALQSTTNGATIIAASAGVTGAAAQASSDIATIRDSLGISPTVFAACIIAVIVAGAAWVIWERHKKSRDYGV